MYQVRCNDEIIYDLRDDDLKIISPKLETELNKTGSFEFIVPPTNPAFDRIKKLKGIITIYQDGEEIWRGRILNEKTDFYNRKQVECEGELAFLLDSIQRPYTFQGSPNDLFTQFITNHNSQVEENKQFVVRNVNVPDNNNYINRSDTNYSNTWEAINEKLIDTNGGYLETGLLQNGQRYIDYISEYENVNTQIIQFGENLLDITEYAKGENIKTAIIPLGARDEDTEKNLTISSVNDGKDYIYDETAVSLFGWIWDTVEYEDVTLPQNLLTKGNQYLNSVINESMTIELSAVDLHNLNCEINRFKKGDWVRVISIPHRIDKLFQVSKLSISLDNPKESKLILGQTFSTLTKNQQIETKTLQKLVLSTNEYTSKISKTESDVQDLKTDVNNLNNTVVEIPTEYVKTTTFEEYKVEVNQKIGSVYTVKGSVANYTALLALVGNKVGDVYNVLDTGANYVFTNDGWDKLSETINMTNYYTKTEANAAFATLASFNSLVSRVEALENQQGNDNQAQNLENEGGSI